MLFLFPSLTFPCHCFFSTTSCFLPGISTKWLPLRRQSAGITTIPCQRAWPRSTFCCDVFGIQRVFVLHNQPSLTVCLRQQALALHDMCVWMRVLDRPHAQEARWDVMKASRTPGEYQSCRVITSHHQLGTSGKARTRRVLPTVIT